MIIIKMAVKDLINRWNSSIISLAGLVIAFITLFYIYSYISFELGYDSHHEKAGRIYRISGEIITAGSTATHAILGPLMGRGLKEHFPAVEEFASLVPIQRSVILESENIKFAVDEAYYAGPQIFSVFTIDFVHGDRNSALTGPLEVVINQNLSHRLFGYEDPVGRTIKDGGNLLTITGVIKDSPRNSHHRFNVLFSHPNPDYYPVDEPEWMVSEWYWMPSAYHFILLMPGTGKEDITDNFDPFYDKYMSPFGEAINARFNPIMIPLRDLHFSTHMSYDYPKGNMMYNRFLAIIALFVLLIATINYSNLLVSRNITRSKSTGIRKIIGAGNSNLFFQLLTGSIVYVLFSLILAGLLFRITLPYMSTVTGLGIDDYPFGEILFFSLIILAVTGFVTCLIPFLGLVGKTGLEMIRPWQIPSGTGSIRFGRLSTIFQYTLSTVLILSALIISRQMNFVINSDMGFDKENVLLVKMSDLSNEMFDITSFRNELLRSPGIGSVAFSTNVPGEVLGTVGFPISIDGEITARIIKVMGVDHDYIPLMGMVLVSGRNFDSSFNDGEFNSVIVNEAFISFCGLSGDITGMQINETTVVGVLENVSFNSLHNPAEPIALYLTSEPVGYLNIKLVTDDLQGTLNEIRATWEDIFGNTPLDYQFLDQRIAMMYAEEQRTNVLMGGFTLVSIILSMMGLVNLSSIIMKRRTKEIGLRKVNGAKIWEVMAMLNMDFVKWVTLAFVIAIPVAWYAMNRWLQNFAYRTELSWWIFALAGLMALIIALLTVSWQSWRAARSNPVEALRYE